MTPSVMITVDATVAPAGVLSRQAQDKRTDGTAGRRPAGSFSARAGGVTAADEVAVPAQNGVRGDDQLQPSQSWAGESVQECGEQGAVCPSQTRFAGLPLQDGELMAQDEDLDVLVGVAHRQQSDDGEHVCERQIRQSQQHDESSWRARAVALRCSGEPAGHRSWMEFSALATCSRTATR